MADKGAPEMTPEVLEAFKAFYKHYTSPESVSKDRATVAESSVQVEAEQSEPSNQPISSNPAPVLVPQTTSAISMELESRVFEEIPPISNLGVICLPFGPAAFISAPNISMPDVVAIAAAVVQSTEGEPEPAAGSPIPDVGAASPSFTPYQYKDMSTLDVVKDVLGLAPQPFKIIPPGEPENPLDCDRDIDLACTARDLLKEGKVGKIPVRSSAWIREDTISKMIKKGDEHRERKKAAASNPECGLIDEVTTEKVSDAEPSFDDTEDLNFKPLSYHSSSESDAADFVVEKPQSSRKTKRKLDVDSGAAGKPAPKGKKQKLVSPAASSHTATAAPPSKAQQKDEVDLSSSDSSTTKKRKSSRYKSTAPAPQKKPLTPRVSPRSGKQAAAATAPRVKSRKHVGQSSTPTLSFADETIPMLMTNEAHSTKFVSKFDQDALIILKSREFRSEKTINPTMFVKYGLDVLLQERGLWLTLTNVFPYNQNVVKEFYANLSLECGLNDSPRYGRVYIRGFVYSFTPELINELFSLPNISIPDWCLDAKIERALVTELTGGRVKKWDSRFQSTKLSCKYAVLHKVVVACWMLSKNTQILTKDQALMIYRVGKGLPFNFGQYVFNVIMKASSDPSGSLLYPNIIFQVLKAQGLDVTPTAGLEIELLTFSNSLLSSDRKQDLPYMSKSTRKVPIPTDSDDSLFEEINQFKGSDAAGPSSQSLSKSVRDVPASLPTLIQTTESLVHALKDAQDVLVAATPALSDADS